MTKKWIAINLLLLGIAGLLGWQLRLSIRQFNAGNDPAKLQPARDIKQKLAQDKIQIQPAPAKTYLPAEFAVIPEKNIFSESRAKEEKNGYCRASRDASASAKTHTRGCDNHR